MPAHGQPVRCPTEVKSGFLQMGTRQNISREPEPSIFGGFLMFFGGVQWEFHGIYEVDNHLPDMSQPMAAMGFTYLVLWGLL